MLARTKSIGKTEYRTLFLKEFTYELIRNTRPRDIPFPEHPLKPQFLHFPSEEQNLPLSLSLPSVIPSTSELSIKPEKNLSEVFKKRISEELLKPIEVHSPKTSTPIIRMQQHFQPSSSLQSQVNPNISSISPAPMPVPQSFSMGKLDSLIYDQNVLSIDCPGPGKLITVKTFGKSMPTQITLTEEEVKNAVNTFSQYSRIPVIGGVFKAAVGNLVITAVLSDFVGSRFIINKYTPFG